MGFWRWWFCLRARVPSWYFPGARLGGEVGQTRSWEFARDYKLMQLETRPQKPYSVSVRITMLEDNLYLDAAKHRKWHQHIRQDNRIRVKIGGIIYQALAILIDDVSITSRFLPGRTIYRLEPII